MIGRTISHYKILDKLGEGGMGVVYKAEDTRLKRPVAIKFLPRHISSNEHERERFQIEAQAAAALNHPNISTIHAIEEYDDEVFIVMEYIDGPELRTKIDSGRMDLEEALTLIEQIAKGLQTAHHKEIYHRDVKSTNVMLTRSGQVKVMDFGLAKLKGSAQITKAGTTVGTVAYMSPEQARGEKIDHRSDIWSLGIILYEMLAGELPYAVTLAKAKRIEEAKAEGEKALELSPNDPIMMYYGACLYARLGENETAVQLLGNAVKNGYENYEWIKRDPDFESIRRESGYIELMKGK